MDPAKHREREAFEKEKAMIIVWNFFTGENITSIIDIPEDKRLTLWLTPYAELVAIPARHKRTKLGYGWKSLMKHFGLSQAEAKRICGLKTKAKTKRGL